MDNDTRKKLIIKSDSMILKMSKVFIINTNKRITIMRKKKIQSEQDFRISKPVEENVVQVEEENKPILTEESDATQPDSNSLVKPEDCKVQKRTMKEVTETLNKNGYTSSKVFMKKGYVTYKIGSDVVGSVFERKQKFDTDLIEIKQDDLNEDEKNTPLEERMFASNDLIKEMQYRGELVNIDDRSIVRVGVFKHNPNLQELEKWGLLVNYDRYNELLDKGAIDLTVNNRLTIPSEVAREIEERREQNLPAAMQRYGDEIHITGKESSLELQDIGIIVDHSAIVAATKDKEEEYNKNLEKLTKTKLLKP